MFKTRSAVFLHSPAVLGGLFAVALSTPSLAQAQAVDPLQIVRNASFNELRPSGRGHTFRYRIRKDDNGKSTLKEVVETREGDMSRLLEADGKPLDGEAQEKEIARLKALQADPQAQARRHKREQADSGRADEMVKLLPDAFNYTYLGMVPGPSGPCYRLKFEPNPGFKPPDREAEVYHGMAGELWIDQAQQRMARLDAHLISDVNFGWGVVGRLFQGGTILVEQKDVGEGHWENTLLRLNLTGKILMVKPLTIHSEEASSAFVPVPDGSYSDAINLLTSLPSK